MKYFTFDGVASTTYNVYVTATNMFDAPEEKVETIEIPFSNNILHVSSGTYSPFIMTVTCLIPSGLTNFIDSFRNFLYSKKKMCKFVDSEKPDEYRMARFKKAFEVRKTDYTTMATFILKFECLPQRFLTSGETEQTFSASGTIANPTLTEAKPLIVISGNGTVTVNGYEITVVNNASDNITIDCDSMQCYRGTENMNSNVTLDSFPVLSPGDNTIELDGVSSAKITPRWWTL